MSNLLCFPFCESVASASLLNSSSNFSHQSLEFANIYEEPKTLEQTDYLYFSENIDFFQEDLNIFAKYYTSSNLLAEVLETQKEKEKKPALVDLQINADSQSWQENNIFVAEGNVNALINGANIKADKIEINQLRKTITAIGNVVFVTGKHYLQASFLKYDLEKKEGRLDDVYGIIDIKFLPENFNLLEYSKSNPNEYQEKMESGVRGLELKDGFILEGSFDPEMKILTNDESKSNSINKWRFKAANIWIKKNGWKAKEVSFTNDPFNPVQSRIDAYLVELIASEEDPGKYMLTAKKSFLIIEDNLKLPMGNREVSNFGSSGWKRLQKWILAIDSRDRDGVYIGRQINPIKLPKNFTLSLQPQYLLERASKGTTHVYPKENTSVNSEKVTTKTSPEDHFGLEAEIKGKTLGWDTKINTDISTFHNKRFANGSRHYIDFTKRFDFLNIKEIETSLFGGYRYQMFDSSVGSDEIYTAYGFNLKKELSTKIGNLDSEYYIKSGLAKYQSESKDSDNLIDLWRLNFNTGFDFRFPLSSFQKKDNLEYIRSQYSPKEISSGLYLNSILRSSYFLYEDTNYQSTITFGIGPELTLGKLKRDYFDFTEVSILPTLTKKLGESPFEFDNKTDLITLKLEFSQHLFGPIVIKTINEWNIDSRSDDYGKSTIAKSAIILQRRAYQLGLFYDLENQSGGISFSLNGFNYKGKSEPF